MSLPVSQYEELLAEVRGLRRKAQRVQQLARPLLQGDSYLRSYGLEVTHLQCEHGDSNITDNAKLSVSSDPVLVINANTFPSLQHGTWPVERTMWNSEPASLGSAGKHQNKMGENIGNHLEINSVMSFASEGESSNLDSPGQTKWSSQQLEAKMDVVHSLLAMLGGQEHVDMGETLLALSTCPESCLAMRQSGCIPLLVQLVQSDGDPEMKKKASQALHNLVNSQSDEKLRKKESRVLKLLEQCYYYTETLKKNSEYDQPECSSSTAEDNDKHPVQTVAHLMKLSFDESHRQVICQLGGIQTIASLIEAEHVMHGSTVTESHCILMRRYACMALTNLTFGDSGNKALLCSFREFMRSLVIQLQSSSDELRQVTASVLRNLSWRADSTSKEILREVGSVTGLMKSAMVDNKENTLKTILSALWNLSAHCTENKSEICAVEGSLHFLVDMLTYKTPTKSLAIIENSGGILRNISSQIAVREDYREILRTRNCLQILLDQLKSPSLTIVSNACGTLWNLSAKCALDQEILWQLGAPTMLKSLNHSKHKMIAMGSSAALKNLLSAKSQKTFLQHMDSTALSLDLPTLPMLEARKQKALMQDLDQSLSETYDNIEKDSPVKKVDKSIEDYIHDSRRKFSNVDGNSSGNFTSLKLDDISTSSRSDSKPKLKLPQSYASSSLPYMPMSLRLTNPGVSSKYDDEFECCQKTVTEEKMPNNDINMSSGSEKDRYSQGKTEDSDFNDDKECELDLLLDFSLGLNEEHITNDVCEETGYKSKTPQFVVSKTTKQNNEMCSDLSLVLTNKKVNLDSTEQEMTDQDTRNSEHKNTNSPVETVLNKSKGKYPLIEEISLEDSTGNGSTKSLSNLLDGIIIDNCLQRSCENSRLVDNRMLDPDAMIESLDRFTAQLVSQASHLTKDEDKYKISTGTGDNTWNDDSSPNEVTFPSLSGSTPNVITFSNEEDQNIELHFKVEENQEPSNEFSLINISTATDNTLIAIEASKMVTVFKNEAEMSLSVTSAASLELDNVQPPSQMNSLTNSIADLDKTLPKSPKLVTRKKSLPSGLMVRRALSNSLKSSSLESLSNLDHINPPSDLMLDFDGSITSLASLPNENVRTDFIVNGLANKDLFTSNSSYNELENINPPSLFNEITDFCNSLADIPTENITSEIFASAHTHVTNSMIQDNNATYCDDDITEFSDANDATPLDSDLSSANSTPKKQKSLTKSMLTRHRRNSARDRYKTYTVSAMEIMKQLNKTDNITEDSQNVDIDTKTHGSSTSGYRSKLTPKEKRQINRSRFDTQVLDKEIEKILQRPIYESVSPLASQNSNCNSLDELEQNQVKTKLSIRRNFRQKRLENKDRFKTQNLGEFRFSSSPVSSINPNAEMELLLQKEADIVLESLSSIKTTRDDLIDCETISLVSNEDEPAEHVSRSPINYRTYHKSWSVKKNNVPVISSESDEVNSEICNDKNDLKVTGKPKIVKPTERHSEDDVEEEPIKGIRGRRKLLYSRSNTNNIKAKATTKTIPNLPKTPSVAKPNPVLKVAANKAAKGTYTRQTVTQNGHSSGYSSKAVSQSSSPKTSPARTANGKGNIKAGAASTSKVTPPLERQGTFTKDEPPNLSKPKKLTTRIPAFTKTVTSQLPPVSRIPSNSNIRYRNENVKSASADRTTTNIRMYNRSISAESARKVPQTSIQSSRSASGMQYGATKKSSIPSLTQRSNSNSSINSNSPSVTAKKQVTSKIASLWKKIEDSKNQPAKKDSRVWIQPEQNSDACQSNTFESDEQVILRNRSGDNVDPTKRVSRLSSFVIMDENDGNLRIQQAATNAV